MATLDGYIIITNPQEDILENSDNYVPRAGNTVGRVTKVSMDTLKKSTKEFLDNISDILEEVNTTINDFQLNQVELTATVTATGKLSLVAGGVEGGFEGGIKFVFERKA